MATWHIDAIGTDSRLGGYTTMQGMIQG